MQNDKSASSPLAMRPAQVMTGDYPALLVEDHQATCKAMCRLLEYVSVRAVAVNTVHAAIAALARMPSLVILDLSLPDGSGLDVLAAIRAANMRCKVAVVSGHTDTLQFAKLYSLKPDAVFSKPLNFEDFAQWLCEAFPEPSSPGLAA